ncbi:MAG: preprotein translocase subunit YajC [Trueperella sp.]|nr:preprotein translocase subunit YajC [Trueperella sp.]
MELVIIIGVMVLFLLFTSRSARKAQKAQQEEQQKAIAVGNNVVTKSGFFGRIVDIDGDAVTLESPSGDETVWMNSAIMGVMEIPLQAVAEEDGETSAEIVGEPETVTPPAAAEPESDAPAADASPEIKGESPFSDDTDSSGSAWK